MAARLRTLSSNAQPHGPSSAGAIESSPHQIPARVTVEGTAIRQGGGSVEEVA